MTYGPLVLDAVQWKPHAFQSKAVGFLLKQAAAALWADPGLGKTSIVLEAFRQLKEAGDAQRMLVVAPLLPATEVWPYEIRKWKQFRHFHISVLHGGSKLKMLRRGDCHKADITVINYEGLTWLLKYAADMPDYDIVVADESTKLKNARAQRSRAWRKLFWPAPRRWGLTGTPAPNGYEDVFGQALALDKGVALGKTISEFRNRYYTPHPYLKYNWSLLPGAIERIETQLAPLTLRMAAEDYLNLPDRIDDVRKLHMTPPVAKQYKELKKDMLLALPGGVVTAANAAALYSKLAQLANGAIYQCEDKWSVLHGIKLDALANLREELGDDAQLLVAYEFRHDIARIRERFGDIAVLSSAMPKAKRAETMAAWNAGDLKTLYMHPAAAGHGINLQGSSAHHICWFSATWNLELYEQTIARLLRQGNRATSVINHILAMADTIDELKLAALCDKDAAQERLLQGLKAELGVETGDTTMAIRKLGQPKAAEEVVEEVAADVVEPAAAPTWGPKKKAAVAPAKKTAPKDDTELESGSAAHRARIRELATTGSVKSAFSADVQEALGGVKAKVEPAPKIPVEKTPVEKAKEPAAAAPQPKTSANLSAKDRLDAIVEMFRAAIESVMRL